MLDDPSVARRFEEKVDRSGECHLWTGATVRGYGVLWIGPRPGKLIYAHRLALGKRIGRDLTDEMALHTCDTPACVRPDHLKPGTAKNNTDDAIERGRLMHGSRHYLAKLTEQDVREIVSLLATPGTTHASIADRYGVSRVSISYIRSGKTWRHVPRPPELAER